MKLAASIALLAASTMAVLLPVENVTPAPGALSMSLNTTSINNVMQTFVPILSYYMLNNKTIETDIHESSLLYKFDLDSIHLDTVDGFTTKVFEEVPGTDKIFCHIGGVNVSMDLNGSLDALHFIPLDASHVDLYGVDLQFTVESTSDDKVHWALVETTKMSFKSMKITMKNSFLQKLVNLSSSIINALVKDMIPQIEKAIDAKVKAFNSMIAMEGPTTFVFPVADVKGDEINLNMTMTTAPDIKVDGNLVNLYFNGMFVDPQVTASLSDVKSYPPRIAHIQSEQFWIHEAMVNGLFQDVGDKLFPVAVSNSDISAQMAQVFREITVYYGADVQIALEVSMDTADPKSIGFSTVDGITFGANTPIVSTIKMICSNATTHNETAAEFQTNLVAKLNLTMEDFVLFPSVKMV